MERKSLTLYLGPGVDFTYFTGTIPTVSPQTMAARGQGDNCQEDWFLEHFHEFLGLSRYLFTAMLVLQCPVFMVDTCYC